MNKQQVISAKIAKLIAEGKPREQAIAIAYSMYENENKAQEGVKLQKPIISDIDYTDMGGLSYNKPMQNYADSLKGVMLTPYGESLREQSVYATTPQTEQEKRYQTEHSNNQYNDWVKYNILNPYGQGMDLNTSLAYTGQQFGQGNTGMGIAGAGLSALKGVRSFLSGYGSGRGQQNVERQMRDKLYNSDENLYQQGGMRIAQQGLGEEEELYGQNQSNNYADLIQQAELQGIAEGADRIYNELQSAPNQGQGLFNGESVAGRAPYQPPMSPNGESTFVPTTVEKTDSNSARDVWTEKTGLPWSEAKRLGYTDGTAKNNTKLLQELKDPRFKKENLRTKPFTAPVAQAKAQVKSAKEAVEAYKKTQKPAQKPTIPSDDYHYNWVEDRHKNDYLDTRTRSQKIKDALNNQLKTFGYELAFQQGGYSEGQEYDLTEEEIHDLLSKGYKIRYK